MDLEDGMRNQNHPIGILHNTAVLRQFGFVLISTIYLDDDLGLIIKILFEI